VCVGLRCGDQEVIPAVNYRCISSYAVVRFLKVRYQLNLAQVRNECMDTHFCVCVCVCVRMRFHCIHDSETSVYNFCMCNFLTSVIHVLHS